MLITQRIYTSTLLNHFGPSVFLYLLYLEIWGWALCQCQVFKVLTNKTMLVISIWQWANLDVWTIDHVDISICWHLLQTTLLKKSHKHCQRQVFLNTTLWQVNLWLGMYFISISKSTKYIVACQRGGGLQQTARPPSRVETFSVNPLIHKQVD